MSGYATNTSVSVARSKAEIEETFNRFGVRDVGHFTEGDSAVIMFRHDGRPYSIRVTLPSQDSDEIRFTPSGRRERTADQAYAAWEQACRVKWRELALLIKAKLVAISNEAASFEAEFLAYAMLPNRQTVGERAELAFAEMQAGGELPDLFPRGQGALPGRSK